MFNKIIILSLLLISNVNANPKILDNIELNKTTLSEVKSAYEILSSQPNSVKGYYDNTVYFQDGKIEYLTSLILISDENEIIVGAKLLFYNSNVNKLFDDLKKKYTLINSTTSNNGDRINNFKDEDCFVIMTVPDFTFLDIEVEYYTSKLYEQKNLSIKKKKDYKE